MTVNNHSLVPTLAGLYVAALGAGAAIASYRISQHRAQAADISSAPGLSDVSMSFDIPSGSPIRSMSPSTATFSTPQAGLSSFSSPTLQGQNTAFRQFSVLA